MKTVRCIVAVAVLVLSAVVMNVSGQGPATTSAPADQKALRTRAEGLQKAGNWKEAFAVFSSLVKDPADDRLAVSGDLTNGLNCLRRLGRLDELDDFREAAIKAHDGNWRLLQTAAHSYEHEEHTGHITAGKFYRGYPRGQAKMVNAAERDRVRGLQLMEQAMSRLGDEADRAAVSSFYLDFADTLLGGRNYYGAWRLQYLSDLTVLPDYEDGYWYGSYGEKGAPVDDKGQPVYHFTPKRWKDAKTDGERWRWCLLQAKEASPSGVGPAQWALGEFCLNQFGVQTMAEYGWYFRGRDDDADDGKKNESGTYELHLLKDTESIAKLANGIKRFAIPDEFNYVKIFTDLAEGAGDYRKADAMDQLARVYENRRQYPVAAQWWKKAIAISSGDTKKSRERALEQIVGNWGQFETMRTQPAVAGAVVDFRYRNGKKVSFEAFEIDVKTLLDDVKAYLKNAPKQLDWEKIELGNIGYRLVEKNQAKYVGNRVADWELKLDPRPNHFDRRVTVSVPVQQAGAYLVKAKMEDGNLSQIVLWLADTAILKKPLDAGSYYFVADAKSGDGIAKANVEFFGYWQEWVHNDKTGSSTTVVHTDDFAELTDETGQLIVKNQDKRGNYQWIATATTPQGRLAFIGFTGIWGHGGYDQEYNQRKTFFISDRPVYRPAQVVKYKFWENQAKYDQEGKSYFAGEKYKVRVLDPKGEKFGPEKEVTLDEFGGADGEITLPKDATLGVYYVALFKGESDFGGGTFRVEEYKKPEFEVKVEAPSEPVMLGEKIDAKIIAKYYFGAPVTEGKVKYKVLRTRHSANWYPVMYWDWLYGPGYWWFGCDYNWYPGWSEWGCKRPLPIWWGRWHSPEKPEVVAEAEVPVGKDGTVKVEIDTGVAKAVYGDSDHKYEITAEVTDASRRTIVGTSNVLVARKPFKVYAWTSAGHYRVGGVIESSFCARTLDGKGVKGKGELKLLKITYEKDKDGRIKPVEKEVRQWALDTNEEGQASQKIDASSAGQFRLSYALTDAKGHKIEGGYVFVIHGEGFDGKDFRFNDIELTADKKEYKPGEKIEMMVNADQPDSTVLLFPRAANGVYVPPKLIKLKGKSVVETIEVVKKDMPNFYVEAVTIHGGKVFTDTREVVVPPEKRVLNVEVQTTTTAPADKAAPAAKEATTKPAGEAPVARFKPGQKAQVTVKLTDPTGEPYKGSIVLAMYDKAVEYISGGSNVPDIKKFFWDWRRHHWPQAECSLDKAGYNLVKSGVIGMSYLGVFGYSVADEGLSDDATTGDPGQRNQGGGRGEGRSKGKDGGNLGAMAPAPAGAPGFGGMDRDGKNGDSLRESEQAEKKLADKPSGGEGGPGEGAGVQPTVRSNFADTAAWVGSVTTDEKGLATIDVTMPENLTTWKTRVWAMGMGTKVGEGTAECVTTKNLIVRLQAPRFFVQKDEVVLSANVHNYLKDKKKVKVVLEIDEKGGALVAPFAANGDMIKLQRISAENRASKLPGFELPVDIEVNAQGEARVDWRICLLMPGEIVVRMKAITDEESDAMQMSFPVYIHGMLKTESYSGVIRPDKTDGSLTVNVPKERLPEQSRLEIRYSPSLALAMVDALPYLADYPYGCTEQTLNRFLPAVITQKVLINMGLDLKEIEKKRSNLNAQEIGDDKERSKDWGFHGGQMSRGTAKFHMAVFDEEELRQIVKANLNRLTNMQCADGGWGWWSGWGEHSYPHTTAIVVHGLQIAKANDVGIVPDVLERGVAWLKNYQSGEVAKLKLPADAPRHKSKADNLDAMVYMVLVDAKAENKEMRDFLYRDRNDLAVYAKAMFGLALHKVGDTEKRDMLIRNVEQFLVQDDENQSAFLKLPENNCWWNWYGSETEADAYYLKLLAATDPKGEKAPRLVKYLLNNRKNATYWNSTRDTAVVVEAFADYLKASGEDKPNMTVEIVVDGKSVKTVEITKDNVFAFDNKLILAGADLKDGKHTVEFKKKGTGPLYFNAYMTNFTLEDPITKAGLEIKVNRKFFKLVEVDAKEMAQGAHGQAIGKKVEKYKRVELKSGDALKSGDLVEIEMEIDSKNDYEYILFEDMKAAGFEPVEVRSGYNGNDLGAYMELRDERVSFFVRTLARGKSSVSYRLRAEIPGKFSALPTKAGAMYAPELRANSDEFKIGVTD